jgi:hypothetical protein
MPYYSTTMRGLSLLTLHPSVFALFVILKSYKVNQSKMIFDSPHPPGLDFIRYTKFQTQAVMNTILPLRTVKLRNRLYYSNCSEPEPPGAFFFAATTWKKNHYLLLVVLDVAAMQQQQRLRPGHRPWPPSLPFCHFDCKRLYMRKSFLCPCSRPAL